MWMSTASAVCVGCMCSGAPTGSGETGSPPPKLLDYLFNSGEYIGGGGIALQALLLTLTTCTSEEEGLHFRPSSSHCGCFRDLRAVPAYGNGCLPVEVSDGCSTVERSHVYSRLIFVGTLCTFCQRRNAVHGWDVNAYFNVPTLQLTRSGCNAGTNMRSLFRARHPVFTPHAQHWADRGCFREPVSGARFENFLLCSFYKVENLASFPSDESMSQLSSGHLDTSRPLKTVSADQVFFYVDPLVPIFPFPPT